MHGIRLIRALYKGPKREPIETIDDAADVVWRSLFRRERATPYDYGMWPMDIAGDTDT